LLGHGDYVSFIYLTQMFSHEDMHISMKHGMSFHVMYYFPVFALADDGSRYK